MFLIENCSFFDIYFKGFKDNSLIFLGFFLIFNNVFYFFFIKDKLKVIINRKRFCWNKKCKFYKYIFNKAMLNNQSEFFKFKFYKCEL